MRLMQAQGRTPTPLIAFGTEGNQRYGDTADPRMLSIFFLYLSPIVCYGVSVQVFVFVAPLIWKLSVLLSYHLSPVRREQLGIANILSLPLSPTLSPLSLFLPSLFSLHLFLPFFHAVPTPLLCPSQLIDEKHLSTLMR